MEMNLKTNKKAISTMLIAVILVIVIVAGGIGAYYILSQNSPGPSESPTPSPTTTPLTTTQPTVTPSSSIVPIQTPATSDETSPTPSAPSQSETPLPTVAPTATLNVTGATSLKYTVSLTENGVQQGAYTYYGKNAGTTNFMMRIEYTGTDGNAIYIFNGAQQKAWSFSDNTWTDISAAYTIQFGVWNNLWQGYVNSLTAWNGSGDYSYTSQGSTVRIYDISVNPTLQDSLFVHS
jgi:flagellar basal body-associated protein FliL